MAVIRSSSEGSPGQDDLQRAVSTLKDMEWWQTYHRKCYLYIVHAGDSAVTTVTIESYTLFPPLDFYALLLHTDFRVLNSTCSYSIY